jgi:hypothetical protein
LFSIFKINTYSNTIKNAALPLTIVIALLILHSVTVISRKKDWKNNYTITQAGLKTNPNSARVHLSVTNESLLMAENAINSNKNSIIINYL